MLIEIQTYEMPVTSTSTVCAKCNKGRLLTVTTQKHILHGGLGVLRPTKVLECDQCGTIYSSDQAFSFESMQKYEDTRLLKANNKMLAVFEEFINGYLREVA